MSYNEERDTDNSFSRYEGVFCCLVPELCSIFRDKFELKEQINNYFISLIFFYIKT